MTRPSGRMPWGKYRGERICDLPASYLAWCLEEANLDSELADDIRDELVDRLGIETEVHLPAVLPAPRIANAAREIVTRGYRALARTAHPDAGGEHLAMVAATDAKDWLMRALERGIAA